MKNKIITFVKYVLLALLIGLFVGAIDALFGRVLLFVSAFRTAHYKFLVPFLPVAGLFIIWSYRRISAESLKGMSLVFETAQNKREKIPLLLVPLIMVGTWITHLFGGSAGREGVAVQIGATLSHGIGRKLKLPENGRVMVITGMAAGFAGLFQTPLAAIFFAMEVVVAGFIDYSALLSAFIASFTASYTSSFLGLEKFSVVLTDTIQIGGIVDVLKLVVLGVAFGLTGLCFSFSLGKAKKFAAGKIDNPYKRIGFVSIPLALVLMFLWSGRYCGLGTNLISASFGGNIYAYDWILKLCFTVITLAIGFQGGEVTPLFSIGASLGFCLGSVLGLPVPVAAALGYAAVFGSATNTLIGPILIGLEVFGTNNMIPFVIVCAIAYVVNGDFSIYSAQWNMKKIGIRG